MMQIIENLKPASPGSPIPADLAPATRLVYKFVVLSIVWILVSDHFVEEFGGDTVLGRMVDLQTIKAILYIGLTGAFIFMTVNRYQLSLSAKATEKKHFFQSCLYPMFIVRADNHLILDLNNAAIENYQYLSSECIGRDIQFIQQEMIEPNEAEKQAVNHITKDHRQLGALLVWEKITWQDVPAYLLHIIELKEGQSTIEFAPGLAYEQRERSYVTHIRNLEQKIEDMSINIAETDNVNEELIRINENLQEVNKQFSKRTSGIIKEKDDTLRDIIETLDDVIWCFDVQTMAFEYLSRSAERIFEKPQHELIESKGFWDEYIHPDDSLVIQKRSQAVLHEGKADFTFRIITPSGMVRWLFERLHMERDEQGSLLKVKGVTSDVTYLKSAEEIIRQAQINLDSVFNNIQEDFIILDQQGQIILFNLLASRRSYLFATTLAIGRNLFSVLCQSRRHYIEKQFYDTVAKKEPFYAEIKCRSGSGEVVWYSISLIPVLDYAGNLQQICFKSYDITEKKQIEHALRINKENLDALINNTRDLLWSIDSYGRIMTLNTAFVDFAKQESDLELQVHDIFPEIGPFDKRWSKNIRLALKGQKINLEGEYKNRRGVPRYYEATLNPIFEGAKVAGVACILRDVSMNKLALRKSKELNRRFKLLSHATNDAVWEWQIEPDRITWNNAVMQIFGYKRASISTLAEWKAQIHPDDLQQVEEELVRALHSGHANWSSRFRFRCYDGTYRHILGRAFIGYSAGMAQSVTASMQDITSLVEAERANQLSDERYRLASRATGDAIYDHDLLDDTILWSEGFSLLFGYPDLKETAENWLERIHPDDHARIFESWKSFIRAGTDKTWREEYRFRKSDGTYAYVLDRGFLVRNEDGDPSRLFGAMMDTTDQMNVISKIRKLSMVASRTNNMVLICNNDFSIVWANDAFSRTLGVDPKALVQKNFKAFFADRAINPFVLDALSEALSGGNAAKEELGFYSSQGKEIWTRMDASPTRTPEGTVDQFILIFSDVTEQKAYETRILNIARELSNVIENANAVIFGVDRNGYVNEWNRVTSRVTAYSRNEVLGTKLLDHFHAGDHYEEVSSGLNRVLEGEAVSNMELSFRAKGGKKTILLISVTPRRDSSGGITGALIVGQDITELIDYRTSLESKVRERTLELNNALKKERELVDMKRRFISVASHEFRTPLSTINFATAYLRRYRNKISDTEAEQKLRTIDQQVKHMNFLLEDVLTLGRNEGSKIQINPVPVDLAAFLTTIIAEVCASFGNSHQVKLQWIPHEKIVITSDSGLLRNIFINLISNAIKFSPDNQCVHILVKEDSEKVYLLLQDQGIGILPQDREKIFEPFHRGENASSIQGTGLGLNIVKYAIDLLKGEIQVSSEPGEGTSFIVTLPRKA